MKNVLLIIVFLAALAFLGKKCSCSCSHDETVTELPPMEEMDGTSKSKSSKDTLAVTGANGKQYTSYKDAVADGNFDAAHQLIELMEKEEDDWDRHVAHDLHDQKTNVELAKEYVFKEEVNYLAGMNTPEANKRIVLLINSLPKQGASRPEGYLVAGKQNYLDDWTYCDKDYKRYIDWCAEFNDNCMGLLDMAISLNNPDLAKSILSLIKPDASIRVEEKGNKYDIFTHYETKSKDEAQQKFDTAFSNEY